MKILAITPGKQNAVSYFRFMLPFNNIIRNNRATAVCLPYYQIDFDKIEEIDFDVIHIHSTLLLKPELVDKLLKVKSIIGIDYDDYWEIPKTNPHKKQFEGFDILTAKYLPKFDFVTTTTKLLAKEIKRYNKNVYILPNFTDKLISQFNYTYKPSYRLRIGLITGASHSADIELLDGLIPKLGDYNSVIQWVLGGFNVGTEPKTSPYVYYERILTGDYDLVDRDYELFLKRYEEGEYPYDEQYKRIWSKDIDNYGVMFQDVDVILAPLVDNKFNSMKSELKIIEAGTFGKVFIGSAVGIYKDKIKNGENGFLCYRMEDFAKNIKRLVNEEGLYSKLQRNLFDEVKNKYDADYWAVKRVECYERESRNKERISKR